MDELRKYLKKIKYKLKHDLTKRINIYSASSKMMFKIELQNELEISKLQLAADIKTNQTLNSRISNWKVRRSILIPNLKVN